MLLHDAAYSRICAQMKQAQAKGWDIALLEAGLVMCGFVTWY